MNYLINKIKFRSRRGILELDLLFNNFYKENLLSLNIRQLLSLNKLLNYPDNILIKIFIQSKYIKCNNSILEIIKKIKNHIKVSKYYN